jgi:hypothetical protein
MMVGLLVGIVSCHGIQAPIATARLAVPLCSVEICVYEHINEEGASLSQQWGYSTYYYDLRIQGWNDRISSIRNMAAHVHYFYWDINSSGKCFSVASHTGSGVGYYPDLRQIDWNDQVSSMYLFGF